MSAPKLLLTARCTGSYGFWSLFVDYCSRHRPPRATAPGAGLADPIERQEPAKGGGAVVEHHKPLAGLVQGDVNLGAAAPAQECREHKGACVRGGDVLQVDDLCGAVGPDQGRPVGAELALEEAQVQVSRATVNDGGMGGGHGLGPAPSAPRCPAHEANVDQKEGASSRAEHWPVGIAHRELMLDASSLAQHQ